MRWLLLFVGGGIGTIFRYQISGLIHDQLGSAFPWGTFVVNMTGCVLIGLLATLADERGMLGSPTRLFLMVGVTGGYTTFSTFSLETFKLYHSGMAHTALAYIATSVVCWLVSVWLGHILASRLNRLKGS